MTRVRNDLFNPLDGLERGKSKLIEIIWYLFKVIFFLSPLPWPSSFKSFLLRCFGAQIGVGVRFKPRINIHFPWKLKIGDYSWLGEEVLLLNFEQIFIGNHCCISQRAFICAGNHDYSKVCMPYRNAQVIISDGVWVGAQAFVSPGITINKDTVVTAGSIVTMNLPADMVCSGFPCVPVKPRWPVVLG